MIEIRRPEFQRNRQLEGLLSEINSLLAATQKEVNARFKKPKYPLLLVIGGPRSGTTLMMQWIASLGIFAYPTNLLSRFYGAPHIGAKIQLLLTHPDFNFRDELFECNHGNNFKSELGKTKGLLEPNDFWYFWRRFIPNEVPRYITKKEEESIDMINFLSEIASIEHVFQKPLAMKGMILEQNIPFLESVFEKIVFLNLRRHPYYNIQSLLESRVKFFGDINKWYSIRPKEYEALVNLDPIRQVAGQVFYKNKAVREGLAEIDETKYIDVDYEEFCENPEKTFQELKRIYGQQGTQIDEEYKGPPRFKSANSIRLSPDDVEAVVEAYHEFSGETIGWENHPGVIA